MALRASTPEAAPFADYEEVFIRSGGVPIALSVWKARKGSPCLVFHPGTMASPLLYKELLHRLREKGFTVIGIHYLSHGDSPRINKKFTFQDMLQNGLDAVGYALERFESPVALMGHSQGGILALAQAGRDTRPAVVFPHCFLLPERPDSIEVTRLGFLTVHRERFLHILSQAATLLPRFPVVVPMYLSLQRLFAGSRGFTGKGAFRHTRLSYPLIYIHSLFTANLSYLAQPGNIRCPVLALAADNDAVFSPTLLRRLLESIQAGHKELILLRGGGHLAPLEPTGAAEIAAIVRERCAALGLFSREPSTRI